MKKILVILVLLMSFSFVYAEDIVVTIPIFDVTIGEEVVDNENNAYPLIVYKDVTYFPMTWNFSRALGLKTDWDPNQGLMIGKTSETEALAIDTSVTNNLSGSYGARIADFNIGLNGQIINNADEEYPVLLFRDVTYFPLTWRFTVEEFGWESGFDPDKGLKISNQTINTTVNIDNSMNNTTTVSNVNNSNVVVTNNNIDNSMNNSNNTYNDYSTTVNNFIDNSVNINNMSASSIADVIANLMAVQGINNSSIKVVDKNNLPLEGAILYLDNEIKGVSNTAGVIALQSDQLSHMVKIRLSGYAQYAEQKILSGESVVVLDEVAAETGYVSDNDVYPIYPAYAEANQLKPQVTLFGEFLEENAHQLVDIQVLDPETGEDILMAFETNGYGGARGQNYHNVYLTFKFDYNNMNGLKENVVYDLLITNEKETIKTTLTATSKPIIRIDRFNKISTIGDYVYLKYEKMSEHNLINDYPLALVSEEGEVIYQETLKFKQNYEDYIQFELVDQSLLEKNDQLYVTSINNTVCLADKGLVTLSKTLSPIILQVDYELIESLDQKILFRVYGYNIENLTLNASIELENIKYKSSTGTGIMSDDGLMSYVDFIIDKEYAGRYSIEIIGYDRFGSFKVD